MADPTQEQELPFKPMSKGLGFHPFSDGLPYAPQAGLRQPLRTLGPAGTGAEAAGPASFVPPPRQPVAQAPAPAPHREAPRPSVWILVQRVLAWWVDLGIHAAIVGAALIAYSSHLHVKPDGWTQWEVLVFLAGGVLVFHTFALLAQEVAFNTSLGKQLLDLRIEGRPWAIIARGFIFPWTVLAAGIGLAWGLIDARHRCLHDWLTDTEVGSRSGLR